MRYALYLLPDPTSALWREASALIGYDAATGEDLAQPSLPGQTAQALRDATEDPRRYGFHMTLKAPFRLPDGKTAAELEAELALFCSQRTGINLGALRLEARTGEDGRGFVCLAPVAPCPPLFLLEQETVRSFEPFRAALSAEDIARRRPDRLTPRQRALLDTFGYPFVLDEFRPHFSLTGLVDTPEIWAEQLGNHLCGAPMLARCALRGIGLFVQPHREARFRMARFASFAPA